MKKLLHEFREFALRGNVMHLAVGVIIGAAFQGIVASFTDNILSPIIGIFARQNFDYLELNIAGATLRYGAFITSVINFIILALVVFFMVKLMNRVFQLDSSKKAKPAEERLCPYCKSTLHKEATRCPACTSEV